jgi:tetratricopeptide (TPR) repeat protein
LGVSILLVAELVCAVGTVAHSQTSAAHPPAASLTQQLREALNSAKGGDPQRAMALAVQMLQEHPDFVPAIKLKGMLLEQAGRTAEAGVAYEQGLKFAPNDPDLLLKTGIYKLAAGDKEDAVKLLLHCTRIDPGDGDAQFYLAQAYHLSGQDDLAVRAMRQSVKAEPDNAAIAQKYGELLCSTRNFADGLRWLLKAKERDSKLPHLNYDLAWAEYSLMDLVRAEEYASLAVKEQPKDANALLLLASAQLKLEQWQNAQENFERVLTLRAADVNVLLDLGHCQLELKDYQGAVQSLRSALRLDPTQLLAHFYLSRAFAAMGRTADAQRESSLHHLMMEQATFVRSRENDEREGAIRAQARQLLADNDEKAALALYREHFKGTSNTPGDAYVFVGKTYLFMGRISDGVRCLQYALKIEPNVRGAHTYTGILALRDGDLPKAESEFKAELENDPNYQLAIAELGEVRYRQERWSEASQQLSRSHTITPELLYMLCDSELHLGKTQDADLTAELVAAYGRNNQQLMQDLIVLLRSNQRTGAAERVSASLTP